jgi:hypothetical protein
VDIQRTPAWNVLRLVIYRRSDLHEFINILQSLIDSNNVQWREYCKVRCERWSGIDLTWPFLFPIPIRMCSQNNILFLFFSDDNSPYQVTRTIKCEWHRSCGNISQWTMGNNL